MKKIVKILLAIVIVSALTVFASGCSFSVVSADKLLHPPKSSVELEQVLEKHAGESISLVSPSSDESQFSSAVTLFDIDCDGSDEAIIFYVVASDETNVHMNIMKNKNGSWDSIGDFNNYGNNVESLSVVSLSSNSNSFDIITTWSYIDSHIVTVHKLSGNENNESAMLVFQESYVSMSYTDVDNDKYSEIFLLTADFSDKMTTPIAKVIKFDDYSVINIGVISLSKDIVGFEDGYCDTTESEKTPFKFIYDFVNGDGQYGTGIIYWNSSTSSLCSMLVDEATDSAFSTARSVRLMCDDINNDTFIEIPVQVPIAGSNLINSKSKVSSLSYTKWCRISQGKKGLKLKSIAKYRFYIDPQCYFEVDKEWVEKTTVSYDAENAIWTYSSYNPNELSESVSLLLFVSVPSDEAEYYEENGYSVLNTSTMDNAVVLYKITKDGKNFGIDNKHVICEK